MNKLILLIAILLTSQVCVSQNVEFIDSMNQDLFQKINAERQKNGLSELRYYFVMQNTLDQVAEGVQTNFCHCFGDTYVTESLYQAGSVDEVIADLSGWKDKKDNPVRRKDISMVTIGVSENENAYYYVIRTF